MDANPPQTNSRELQAWLRPSCSFQRHPDPKSPAKPYPNVWPAESEMLQTQAWRGTQNGLGISPGCLPAPQSFLLQELQPLWWTETGIGSSRLQQCFCGLGIQCQPLGLSVGPGRTTPTGTFIRWDAWDTDGELSSHSNTRKAHSAFLFFFPSKYSSGCFTYTLNFLFVFFKTGFLCV